MERNIELRYWSNDPKVKPNKKRLYMTNGGWPKVARGFSAFREKLSLQRTMDEALYNEDATMTFSRSKNLERRELKQQTGTCNKNLEGRKLKKKEKGENVSVLKSFKKKFSFFARMYKHRNDKASNQAEATLENESAQSQIMTPTDNLSLRQLPESPRTSISLIASFEDEAAEVTKINKSLFLSLKDLFESSATASRSFHADSIEDDLNSTSDNRSSIAMEHNSKAESLKNFRFSSEFNVLSYNHQHISKKRFTIARRKPKKPLPYSEVLETEGVKTLKKISGDELFDFLQSKCMVFTPSEGYWLSEEISLSSANSEMETDFQSFASDDIADDPTNII